MHYNCTTKEIAVSVESEYLAEESDCDEGSFVWAYHVKVENQGERTVQLINRSWKIIDANGLVQEVKGEGVIGHQPILMQGESFEYASGTQLPTDSGVMVGTYEMVDEDEQSFLVDIPMFSLMTPARKKRAN